MKKNKMYAIFIVLSIVGLLFSCVEDKGSKITLDINEIEISGIEFQYDKTSYFDTLKVSPVIDCSLEGFSEDNLEYAWFFCQNSESLSNHKHEQISSERDLVYKVNVPPGMYTIYFQVTDKSTGVKYDHSFSLYATSQFVRGFYLYGDKSDGTVGLDFVSMPMGKDTTLIKDIFINSLQIKGAKDLIFTGHKDNGYNALWAVTRDNQYSIEYSAQLERVDVIQDQKLEDRIYPTLSSVQRPFHLMNICPGTWGPNCISLSGEARMRLIVTENEIFTGNMALSEAYGNPINRDNANTDQLFKPYPVAFYSAAESSVSYVCFFDMTNHCFKKPGHRIMSSATKCDKPSVDSEFPFYFDQNKYTPVRQIVYGENGYGNNGRSYALMNDADGNYWVYAFTAPMEYASDPIKHYASQIDLSVATDFARAAHYAFFSEQMIILYSVGNLLYAYDYNRHDLQVIDMGAEITYLAMEHQSTLSPSDFIVATYDDFEKGVVRKYSIADDVNTIKIVPYERAVWGTDLKVVKIIWQYSNY